MKNVWEKYDDSQLQELEEFCGLYRQFLDQAKTERLATKKIIELAREKGFKDISEYDTLKTNDKVYFVNRAKNVCLYVIGEEPLENGLNILGAHIDSPRIDLKQNPLYEADGLCLLKTHYYGGIKKYQWVAQPLAMYGVVVKKDGSVIDIAIGDDLDDVVVGISDLLIHLAANQLEKKASRVIEGEGLNVFVGSKPLKGASKDPVKANILKILKEKYDIDEADFVSAEIEVVPAGKARNYGLDSSMIMGYGHDDRVCAYTSLRGILDTDSVKRSACCILVDKEEVGSQGATGMHSRFFENTIAELYEKLGGYSELKLRRCLTNSYMLSSDVNVAQDPNFPEVTEKTNTAHLGCGVVFAKYTGRGGKGGSNDANAEYLAKIRKVMDDHQISYQTGELGKVDQGGGGTIAYILANLNMEVIDCGIGLHNMHACYEIASKADIYEVYKCYLAFLKDMA